MATFNMSKHRFNKAGICTGCRCSEFVAEHFSVTCPPSILSHCEKARWCSWCYRLTKHRQLRRNILTRNDYVCLGCGNHTVECRAPRCREMARGSAPPQKPGWFDKLKFSDCYEWCSVHDGSVASFQCLHSRVSDISEYLRLTERDATNYSKVTKVVGGALATAAIITPAAILSAPAMASALGTAGVLGAAGTGTAISSLSGAALTSASLAALGGSVAGGTMVVTAAGTALGAWQGGMISNAYAREVEGFRVRKISNGPGIGPAVVCIDGFLTQGTKGIEKEWIAGLSSTFPKNPWYHIEWESKTLADLGKLAGLGLHRNGIPYLAKLAKKAMKKPSMGFGSVLTGLHFLRNPWHIAMVKAMMTGAMIADMLCRTTQKREFTLIGHSLGARVIFYALEALATRTGRPRLAHAILLGGAVGHTREPWEDATKAVSGKIINCFSLNDDVLRYLYTAGTAFTSDPVGRIPIPSRSPQIANVDVSQWVAGHMAYKPVLADVLARVAPLLR